jgi:methylenetetrahydrofolate dehydrogenase (NADP+) / methenyltetrahydrofolate cyclohydrolase
MTLLDGRPLAAEIRARAEEGAAAGPVPVLAALVATDDPAAAWYLDSIGKAAAAAGVGLLEERVADGQAASVLERLGTLSGDTEVDGIICLTPLPAGLTLAEAGERIDPRKDVDGASPESLGRLAAGLPAFAPATAQAALELLHWASVPLAGAEAVVVGRSTVVGKPLALLLLAAHATVTVCHTRTRDLAAVTRRAEVLVAAAGRAHLIGTAHVAPGAVVIDVGTNKAPGGGLVGDVDTEAVEAVAGLVTPVPGGVGPVTTAVLLRNVVSAARTRAR